MLTLLLSGYSKDYEAVSGSRRVVAGQLIKASPLSPINQQIKLKTPRFTPYRVAYNIKFVNNTGASITITGPTYESGGVPIGGFVIVAPHSEGVLLTGTWIDPSIGSVATGMQLEIVSGAGNGTYNVAYAGCSGSPSTVPNVAGYAILYIDYFFINSTLTSTPSFYICDADGFY